MSTDPSDTVVSNEQYWSAIKDQRQQALRLIAERDQARAWAIACWEALTPEWRERIIKARELPEWLDARSRQSTASTPPGVVNPDHALWPTRG